MQVKHFDSMNEVMAHLRSEVRANPYAQFMKDGYQWVNDGGAGRLIPSKGSSFWSPFLYRGQTRRYTPCVPGVFRGLPKVNHPDQLPRRDHAQSYLAGVRLEEFMWALTEHPAYEFSSKMGLVVSSEALAQHYELPTGRLDLTQDPDVAAFFATNWRDDSGTWYPMEDGESVVYRLGAPHLMQGLGKHREFYLEWIGKQAWPRPGEQKGGTLLVPLGADFEDIDGDIFTFRHDAACGRQYNDLFDGGKTLFPPDVLSEVADSIRTCATAAKIMLVKTLERNGFSGAALEEQVRASIDYFQEHLGVEVVDRTPISLTEDQKARAMTQVDEMKKTFLDNVWVYPVRTAKPGDVEELRKRGVRVYVIGEDAPGNTEVP